MQFSLKFSTSGTAPAGVFATGTPISNSMVELYTIQRYLQYNTLVKNGLQHFDAWASTFGETITAVELTPEGMVECRPVADLVKIIYAGQNIIGICRMMFHHSKFVLRKPSRLLQDLITPLEYARSSGAAHAASSRMEEVVEGADLVVLATPARIFAALSSLLPSAIHAVGSAIATIS